MKTKWFKWMVFVLINATISLPFIIAGPVALLGAMTGHDIFKIKSNTPYMYGAALCLLISTFAIPNLIYTLLLPWRGGNGTLPMWHEFTMPWAAKPKEEQTDSQFYYSTGEKSDLCLDCRHLRACKNEYGEERGDGDDYRAIAGTTRCRKIQDGCSNTCHNHKKPKL